MPANPLPVHLPAECRKAQKILDGFANPVHGLDDVVPASVLRRAKGFCLLSVAKAGFLFSGRAGTGVVIARLDDGTWSAPSAVGTAGAGFGLQVGVELAEFLIILNSRAAVKSFTAAGSLTLGGNMSIAAGPLGRNVEGTGALSAKGAVAAMYSYSRTKGLFGGASVEGSIIVERSDANAKAYGQNVTAKQLLSGAVEPPNWALPLIETISRLATPARSLPGGGWSTDSPLESPAPSTPGGADIAADEEGYFSRARAQRRIEEQQETGLTPREYKERGYAFGSSFAATGSGAMGSSSSFGGGGSGSGSPAREKLAGGGGGGRFGAMLGSVGRSRSGSGSASLGGGSGSASGSAGYGSAQMSKKSSLGPSGAAGSSVVVEDPFAGGAPAADLSRVDPPHRFETHFADEFDFDAAAGRASPNLSNGNGNSNGRRRSPTRERDLIALDDADDVDEDDDARGSYASRTTITTASRKDGPLGSTAEYGSGSRANETGKGNGRSRASSSASNSGPSSWFSRSTSSPSTTSRPKLTKNRSSSNAAAASAGLRDFASGLNWDARPGDRGAGRAGESEEGGEWRSREADRDRDRDGGQRDSLDESFSTVDPPARPGHGFGRDAFGFGTKRKTSAATTEYQARDRAATLAGGDTRRAPPASALAAAGAGRARAASSATATLPAFDDAAAAADDDDDDDTAWGAARRGGGDRGAPSGRARAGTGGSAKSALDLRPVEADFERVLSLSKHGGDGEVGAASGIGGAAPAAPSPLGGRSRSGTGGGIGTAIALFDFPGVESTDLPFKKNDVITILSRDDEEWWKGRLRLREGMIPRNYVEAHFT